MSKTKFIRDAASRMMLHPEVVKQPPEKWCDMSIFWAERLWDRLRERGYGETTEKKERSNERFYPKIQDQEYFDKCWAKYGREGSRETAAKAWLKIEESDKPKIYDSILRYLDQLGYSKKAKAHFSTWLNERRWEAFEKIEQATQKPQPVYDEKAARIKQIEGLLKGAQGKAKDNLLVELSVLQGGQ